MERRVVVLLGLPGVGKTTVATWLAERGFGVLALREPLWEAARALWPGAKERQVRELEGVLRERWPSFLGESAARRLQDLSGRVVVDGVEEPADLQPLRVYEPEVIWVRRPRAANRRQLPLHYEEEYERLAGHRLENVADLQYLRRRLDIVLFHLAAKEGG